MSSVYLVGADALDLKGPERLEKFLGFVRPDCICLETSGQYIKDVLASRKQLQSTRDDAVYDALDGLYALFLGKERLKGVEERELGLELKFLSTIENYPIWVPEKYRIEQNPSTTIVPVYTDETLLNNQRVFREVLGNEGMDANEDFKSQFMSKFATAAGRARLQENIDKDYLGIDTLFADHPEAKEVIPLITEIDEQMETVLRDAVKENPNRTTVLVCGTYHIFADYGNLYKRLQDISAVRVRLPEIDEF